MTGLLERLTSLLRWRGGRQSSEPRSFKEWKAWHDKAHADLINDTLAAVMPTPKPLSKPWPVSLNFRGIARGPSEPPSVNPISTPMP